MTVFTRSLYFHDGQGTTRLARAPANQASIGCLDAGGLTAIVVVWSSRTRLTYVAPANSHRDRPPPIAGPRQADCRTSATDGTRESAGSSEEAHAAIARSPSLLGGHAHEHGESASAPSVRLCARFERRTAPRGPRA